MYKIQAYDGFGRLVFSDNSKTMPSYWVCGIVEINDTIISFPSITIEDDEVGIFNSIQRYEDKYEIDL